MTGRAAYVKSELLLLRYGKMSFWAMRFLREVFKNLICEENKKCSCLPGVVIGEIAYAEK